MSARPAALVLLLGSLPVASGQTASPTNPPSESARFGEWKIAEAPVLQPGSPPAWDDFAIGSVSVHRLREKWSMIYEGAALSEDGRAHGFGIAESQDGTRWKKHGENPVFSPGSNEWELPRAPSVAKWRDAWWAVYVVERTLPVGEDSVEDFNLPSLRGGLGRAGDGQSWKEISDLKELRFTATRNSRARPGLYADGDALHLWWIDVAEKDEPALFHSISRDGSDWSKPTSQLTREIDPRPMCCARVYPSGDFYILVYVVRDESVGRSRIVTRISRNARTWSADGPPEFDLGAHWQHAVPSMVFSKEGVHLFYCEPLSSDATASPGPRDPVGGAVLRSAFCPKK